MPMKGSCMGRAGSIGGRVLPTAKAVPPSTEVEGAEVLPTSRKLGPAYFAPRPSRGRARRECLGRGYDLIQQAALAPFTETEHRS